ncbi:MAG: allantoin permease [Actinobacteria bacterium]|uniref:Unannotated protein n=1 Tax=freshwater metagenome TaxID=449393 RepID=A0A6J7VL43_9ZZZZ|nr:allantoin permease [Actinomycetota bacterium]
MSKSETSLSTIEARHIDYVPESERHGKVWKQGPFWFLGNFQPFTVSIGFIGPLVGLNFLWTSIAAISGILFGTLFMAAHAAQGPKLGLPQLVQSRAQFGYRGVTVPLIATTFTFIAFNVVDTVIIKEGVKNIFGWNATLVAICIGVLAVLLAIYGHDWLHRVFQILFWASLPFWIVLTGGIIFGQVKSTVEPSGAFSIAGFFAMFAVAASYNITYAPYVSDYSRYLPKDTSTSAIIKYVFIGASGSPIWLIPLGAWLATRLGVADALAGIHDAGNATFSNVGTILAILAVLALVATMGLNAYSGMLGIVTAIDSYHPVRSHVRIRVVSIVAMGIIWFILGLVLDGATSVLNSSLLVMLYLLAPWTAINLIDFYFVRHGKYAITDLFSVNGIYHRWNKIGIISYAIGIAVEIPFMFIPGYYESAGAIKLQYVDISWIIGLAVGGGLYYILSRSLDLNAEKPAIEKSEEMLAATGLAR